MFLMIMINHLLGIRLLNNCSGRGMFSIGKMKPDNKMVGSIRANMLNSMAVCWLLLTVEMKMPIDKAMRMNSML